MQGNGNFQVSNVQLQHSTQLTPAGTITQNTVLTFTVGENNNFTVQINGPDPQQPDILAAITAKVELLKAIAAGVAQLNQQNQLSK